MAERRWGGTGFRAGPASWRTKWDTTSAGLTRPAETRGAPIRASRTRGGQIGVWGLNVATLALKPPATADFMGYCSPDWVSDYSWIGMIAHRESGVYPASPTVAGSEGLLVWGRLRGDAIVLEPAFRVALRSDHLPRPGRHRVELLDAAGSVLAEAGFAGQPVGDLPGAAEEHFAFVLSVAPEVDARLAGIRVVAGGRAARQQAASGPADLAIAVTRCSAAGVALHWDGGRFPMALVRDAGTGEVLSFARGGAALIAARGQALDMQLSDGVRAVRGRRPVPPL